MGNYGEKSFEPTFTATGTSASGNYQATYAGTQEPSWSWNRPTYFKKTDIKNVSFAKMKNKPNKKKNKLSPRKQERQNKRKGRK